MKQGSSNPHLSAERLHAYLDGELPEGERLRAEAHVASCARCTSELDGWKAIFADLEGLAVHRPHQGFADRVMHSVAMPQPQSPGHRLRALVAALPGRKSGHVDAERLQDMFDGVLAARMTTRIQSHLDECPDCSAEAARWVPLFARLDRLETFVPREGFAERVMAGVTMPVWEPRSARVLARITGAVRGTPASEHPSGNVLQDFVDGALPARALARIRTHLQSCHDCRRASEGWRDLADQLVALERFGPSRGFADRVMAGVRVADAVKAPLPVPMHERARRLGARLVPQTREAWAALSGVAVTPVVITGLVLYAVFSHATLTLGSLMSFAWWQVTDMATIAFSALSATALQSVETFGASALLDVLTSAPYLVAGGVLAYSTVSALALRVLYRNLIANRPEQGRYAHVSTP